MLKPPELAPLTLLQLGEGLPQGVLNIIPGLAPLPQLDLDFHKDAAGMRSAAGKSRLPSMSRSWPYSLRVAASVWVSQPSKDSTSRLSRGRFRSCLTQSEDYVLVCYRYIEMNPVQAGMVRPPRDHRWSSYRANAEGKVDRLITPHKEYLRLGSDPTGRHYTYLALFKAPLEGALID